jgi:hypothetical protein
LKTNPRGFGSLSGSLVKRQADVLKPPFTASKEFTALRRKMVTKGHNSSVPYHAENVSPTSGTSALTLPRCFWSIPTWNSCSVYPPSTAADIPAWIVAVRREVPGARDEQRYRDQVLMELASHSAEEGERANISVVDSEADERADRRVRPVNPSRIPRTSTPTAARDEVTCVAQGMAAVYSSADISVLSLKRGGDGRQANHQNIEQSSWTVQVRRLRKGFIDARDGHVDV